MGMFNFKMAVVVVKDTESKTRDVYITRPFKYIPDRSQSDFIKFIDNSMSACIREKKKDKEWSPVKGINDLLRLEMSDNDFQYFVIEKHGDNISLEDEINLLKQSRIFILDFSNPNYYHAWSYDYLEPQIPIGRGYLLVDEDDVIKNMQMKCDNVTSSCIKHYPESSHKVTDYSLEINDLQELETGIISVSCVIKTGIISISGKWFVDDDKRELFDVLSLATKHHIKLYRHIDSKPVYEGEMEVSKVELGLDAYKAEGYATMSIVFEGV